MQKLHLIVIIIFFFVIKDEKFNLEFNENLLCVVIIEGLNIGSLIKVNPI